ncbi:hypothetical protein B9G98_03839 [Wickerhamiella sorbophila]|uniref:Zinc metalloprotease n=1 Tax=Wickerhamiella sorbophila TaxID=45607 RepID=A0A2T0FMM2_9ASCO|nr:hypothetical protein B9G98_03839 [Wickerhamiella sorbophila]PRT56219.1 hypothetical protein B9G98_03839 [Wickerhamiella sorbophila]
MFVFLSRINKSENPKLSLMLKLLAEIHPTYAPFTTIYNWVSPRTGLQVVLVKRQTPSVEGYFTVATEIADNSGCPHTLEHLVFMGSKAWPYKGLLDVLGAKQMSSTNAWTGQDQTVYTLTTAGWQGFSTLLPIYLDHLLNPTLTDDAFVTEVYHIDGEGQERGVVFSEMQGVENTSFALLGDESQKLLYHPQSGYASNTGGLMASLRTLDNESIKKYHHENYRADNLSVIITGDVEPTELVNIMTEFDHSLPDMKQGIPRPFLDSKIQDGPLTEKKTSTFLFPDKDESSGLVELSWIGPPATDYISNTALYVLGSYFTMTGVGKLQLALLDVADPLATEVTFYTDDYLKAALHFCLTGVPVERLANAGEEVMDVIIKEAANVDMALMKDCIERRRDKFLLNAENDPSTFAYIAIDAFLYGKRDGSTLREWTESTKEFDELAGWSADQWSRFIKAQFITNLSATIIGRPSREKYEKLKADKKQRLEDIRNTKDLKQLGERLEEAKRNNEVPIPDALLETFDAPDVNRVKFIDSKSASTYFAEDTGQKNECVLQYRIDEDASGCKVPLSINFESFESQFVAIKALFSATVVDEDLLPLVQVLLSETFSMPMHLDDGTELTFEQVAKNINRDTVVNKISVNHSIQEMVSIDIRVRAADYKRAIEWVKRAMFNVVWDVERMKIFLQKHLMSLADEKREGSALLTAAIYKDTLTARSLRRQSEGIITEEDIKGVIDMENLQKSMKHLMEQLYQPNNMRILVYGDIEHLEQPVSAWKELYERFGQIPVPYLPVPTSSLFRTELGRDFSKFASLTVCPATESCYMSVITNAPTEYTESDLPVLSLCCDYLQVPEGPLWKEVRGAGLAYGARFYVQIETGQLVCNFYRATDAIKALKVTQELAEGYASKRVPFDDEALERAVFSHVSDTAADRSTYSAAITQKFFDNQLRKRGPDFVEKFLDRIGKVTVDELLFAIQAYIMPLFSASTSAIFAVCHPEEAEGLEKELQKLGYEVKINEAAIDSDMDESDNESGSESGFESDSESD